MLSDHLAQNNVTRWQIFYSTTCVQIYELYHLCTNLQILLFIYRFTKFTVYVHTYEVYSLCTDLHHLPFVYRFSKFTGCIQTYKTYLLFMTQVASLGTKIRCSKIQMFYNQISRRLSERMVISTVVLSKRHVMCDRRWGGIV